MGQQPNSDGRAVIAANGTERTPAGTQAPPVDTNSLRNQKASSGNTDGSDPLKQTEPAAPKYKDRHKPGYQAQKQREYRARKKAAK